MSSIIFCSPVIARSHVAGLRRFNLISVTIPSNNIFNTFCSTDRVVPFDFFHFCLLIVFFAFLPLLPLSITYFFFLHKFLTMPRYLFSPTPNVFKTGHPLYVLYQEISFLHHKVRLALLLPLILFYQLS